MSIGANLISENFDFLTPGDINGQGSYTHASSWNTVGTGGGCSVSVESDRMRLEDNINGQQSVVGLTLDSGFQSVSGYIQCTWMHDATDFTTYLTVQSSQAEDDTIFGIGLDSFTGEIRGFDGADWFTLQAFSKNVTYTLRINFNITLRTATFYVNGALRGTATLVGPTNPVTHIYFQSVLADVNTNSYIDDFVFAGDTLNEDYTDTVTDTVSTTPTATHQAAYRHTATDTVSVIPTATHLAAYTHTVTDTVGLTNLIYDSKTLKTDYGYYLGTANGTVHLYSVSYKGDAGVVIPCQYVTKDTDFSDQSMESNDQWKTVYGVKVFYEDMFTDTDIVVAISTDGGATWPNSQSRTLGTGSETRKDAMFWFLVTGQFFRFRISSGSSSTTFKFLGMEIEYEDAGPHWVVA